MTTKNSVESIKGDWLKNCVVLAGSSCRHEIADEVAKALDDKSCSHFELDKGTLIFLVQAIGELCKVKEECGKRIAILQNPNECFECGVEDGDRDSETGEACKISEGLCQFCKREAND